MAHRARSRPSWARAPASRRASSTSMAESSRSVSPSPRSSLRLPPSSTVQSRSLSLTMSSCPGRQPLVSMRLAATTVTFSTTMSPRVPVSPMALHWHPE